MKPAANNILGKRLRECRGTKPARVIGAALGITQQTLTGYERGRAEPDCAMLVALSKHYGVTTDWLLGVSSSPHAPLASGDTLDLLRKLVEIETEAQARRMSLLAPLCRA